MVLVSIQISPVETIHEGTEKRLVDRGKITLAQEPPALLGQENATLGLADQARNIRDNVQDVQSYPRWSTRPIEPEGTPSKYLGTRPVTTQA